MNSTTTNKNMEMAIYASLMSLSLGLFTSITFSALAHIFIIIPCFYFLPKTDFKKITMSTWFLLIMIAVFILSVIFNQDISTQGYAPLTKMKYYLIGALSIAPYSYYFSKVDGETRTKKIHWLILALFITTTVAGVYGLFSIAVGFNFIKWVPTNSVRNGGFAGMLLNYAHNLGLFQVLVTGMIYYRDEVKKYIELKWLYIVWVINFIALYMTYARGPLLAFLIAIPFYAFRANKKLFLKVVLGLLIASAVIYPFADQLSKRPGSSSGRISQWKAAVAGFKERPVLGLGYLNFEHMAVAIKHKYGIEEPDFGGHAHNNYFEALASTGIIGLLFFLLWQISWMVEMYKRDDLVARLALPIIIAFIIEGLTQATFVLGANLFCSMTFYALTQINTDLLKVKKV